MIIVFWLSVAAFIAFLFPLGIYWKSVFINAKYRDLNTEYEREYFGAWYAENLFKAVVWSAVQLVVLVALIYSAFTISI